MQYMKRFIVAFSTLPNTFHTGMLLGYAQGKFKNKGLELIFQLPDSYHFVNASAVKVASMQAHIGFASPFLLHSFLKNSTTPTIKAVSAPVQHDFFAYAIQNNANQSQITQFDLTGKRFAIHNAEGRLEELRYYLYNNHKHGFIRPVAADGLHALSTRIADVAYINTTWDAALLEEQGLQLSYLKRSQEDLVLGYNPVYIAHPEMWKTERRAFMDFFEIANEGYLYASVNPTESAMILHKAFKQQFPHFDKLHLLEKSLLEMSHSFVNENNQWGCMSDYSWKEFLLANKRIEKANAINIEKYAIKKLNSSQLFTNELLPY